MNMSEPGKLHFAQGPPEKFPCLDLAMTVADAGGAAPAVLNGGNEAVVAAYLLGETHFLEIARILQKILRNISI